MFVFDLVMTIKMVRAVRGERLKSARLMSRIVELPLGVHAWFGLILQTGGLPDWRTAQDGPS